MCIAGATGWTGRALVAGAVAAPDPAPAAAGRRSASALASSTLSTAVPIEAATCWLMLSVVLARAMAARRSVCIAPENVGIIVAPIPRPITNSSTPKVQ